MKPKAFQVLLVGAGGLGTAVALGLTKNWSISSKLILHILDSETVELSNLNRQVLFDAKSIGQEKAAFLSRRLEEIASSKGIEFEAQRLRFTPDNGLSLLNTADYVIDATDHSASKFLINDMCVEQRVPFCHGGALGYRGQALSVIPSKDSTPPCLRCVFGDYDDDDCQKEDARVPLTGILGPVAGMAGFLQAGECLRYFNNLTQDIYGSRLLRFSATELKVHCFDLGWEPNCHLNHGRRT